MAADICARLSLEDSKWLEIFSRLSKGHLHVLHAINKIIKESNEFTMKRSEFAEILICECISYWRSIWNDLSIGEKKVFVQYAILYISKNSKNRIPWKVKKNLDVNSIFNSHHRNTLLNCGLITNFDRELAEFDMSPLSAYWILADSDYIRDDIKDHLQLKEWESVFKPYLDFANTIFSAKNFFLSFSALFI